MGVCRRNHRPEGQSRLYSIVTFSGLKECDGDAVEGAAAPATVLTTPAAVGSFSVIAAVGLDVVGEPSL